ncbi:MAG: pilus assembly protein [Planctomycetes bacterium]|nr:pilus assembly protein [Planctomycetota bacterium]
MRVSEEGLAVAVSASRNLTQGREDRRGGAAIEMAIILPLLVTLVLGAIDFGRFAHTHIAVTNAARAGAGYGIMNPFSTITRNTWDAQVRQAVIDELTPGFNASNVTISVATATQSDGLWRVSVTVTYPFQTVVNWPLIPGYKPPLNLRRTVVLRAIR